MPWKLLAFIAVMALVLVFVGFNLDNRCDLSIVFFTFSAVPVVITILSAYLLGLLSAFFLAIGRRGGSKRPLASPREKPAGPAAQGIDDAVIEPRHEPDTRARSRKRP